MNLTLKEGILIMKQVRQFIYFMFLGLFLASIFGCSRTPEDVARWTKNGNVEKLIAALEDPKPVIREGAAKGLGELKAVSAIDPLAKRFSDSKTNVVVASVGALVKIGAQASDKLIEVLKMDNPVLQKMVIKPLGELKVSAAVEPLIEKLNDSDEEIVRAAISSLALIGDEKATPALLEKMGSSTGAIRVDCLKALLKTGGEGRIEAFVAGLVDEDADFHAALVDALVSIGSPARDALLKELKASDKKLRAGVLEVLNAQKDLIPTEGDWGIWYQLASASVDDNAALDVTLADALVDMKNLYVLIEAGSHSDADIRQYAAYALEKLGKPAMSATLKAAEERANPEAKAWLDGRSTWKGAPSWRLSLWAAIKALNPEFKPSPTSVPEQIKKLNESDFMALANLKKQIAQKKAEAVLPLIAAMFDSDEKIATQAADILQTIGDRRAIEPLKEILRKKLAAKEPLSTSTFYSALQSFDDPEAEVLLLKIRPNSYRAMHVFDRKYSGVQAKSASTQDGLDGTSKRISFRIGYVDGAKIYTQDVSFEKNKNGDWVPTPALPENPVRGVVIKEY